jgi:hypothetical protein
MKYPYSASSSIAALCVLFMQPAYALQADVWIDLSNPQITYTDLSASDGITPNLTLSNFQIGASVWEYAGYFQTVDGGGQSSTQWPVTLNFTYTTTTPPGATGTAGWSQGIGTAALAGHVDGGHMLAASGFYSSFSLTPNSEVQFSFPGRVTLNATGHDNLRIAYANLQGYFQPPDNVVQGLDYLHLESWPGFHDLSRNLVLTLTNTGEQALTGQLNITGQVDIVSTAPIPEPETWAMLLAGLGLVGLQAIRSKGFQRPYQH